MVIFDVDCARGSASVIYIDMCEMFVNRYAYDMFIICELYDNTYGTMCSMVYLR